MNRSYGNGLIRLFTGFGRARSIPTKLAWISAVVLLLRLGLLPAADGDAKRIGIMLFDGVLTSDVTAPMEVFGHAIAAGSVKGYEVVTVAREAGSIRTFDGVRLSPDYSLDDAPDLDVIIVGSSYDMDPILEDEAFMGFIRERGAEAEWLASNCSGALILAAAGFLDGKRATTYPGGEVWLKLKHPSTTIEINETVVVDGNIVTSNGSLVSYEAALELLTLMAGEHVGHQTARGLYYNRLLERGEAR
jgi:transcriptional regulator GlxA family with amidase domain